VCEEESLREDLEGRLAEVRAGVEELPCELVREQHFLATGIPAKQLWSWRKGMGGKRERVGWSGRGQGCKVSAGSAP
jgi:hypothetical protein